jgi:oligopeptide transport system substrate-binding protein
MRSGKKFTLGFLPTLFALVAMFIVGCGPTTTTPTASTPSAAPKSQQVYRVGLPASDIATFDPAEGTDSNSIAAIDTVFTGLVQLNDKLEVVDQLASGYTVSADGLTYTFTLKPNLHFSDGAQLTATDVAYSIDRALSPSISSLNGVTLTYLGLIKDSASRASGKIPTLIGDSLIVTDPNTIQIIVSKKTAYFLEALTYPTAYVVEQSVITKWGIKWTDHLSDNNGDGGDGPWKVQSYSHTTGIVLVPNTYYYGKAQTLQRLELDFYKDTNTMYSAYLANQIDNSAVPSADDTQAEAKTKEFREYGSLAIFYLTMNYLYKPFDDIKIRQALSLAVNRDVLAKDIYHNLVTPSCHIVPSGMPGYDTNLKCAGGAATKGDPTLARQLFQQGLTEEGLTTATFPAITLTYPSGSSDTADLITTIIGMWSSVLGINITGHAEDFNQLLTDVNGSVCATPDNLAKCQNKGLAMWWLGWIADYPDPQDWTTLQFDKGAPNNAWNYGQNLSAAATEQQAVQTTLEQADADLGSDRMSLYNQAEQSLVNDVTWLSLYQSDVVGLIKSYVQGVVNNAQGLVPPDDWANIYISAH